MCMSAVHLTMYGIRTFFYRGDYFIRDRCIKEMFYCSISDAWRTPQTNHFTSSADSIIYIILHLILRATNFLQELLKRTCGYIVCPNTQSQSLFCYGKQFFFTQISPSVTKSNKLSWKFALILLLLLLLCRIE